MADDQRLRELMREYQGGRFDAFDGIYASAAPALRRYLLSQARDAAKADDLVRRPFCSFTGPVTPTIRLFR